MASEFDSGDGDHHSGIGRFVIGISPEQRSPSLRNRDRHHPGIAIAIRPERRSAWPGIRNRFEVTSPGLPPDLNNLLRDLLLRIEDDLENQVFLAVDSSHRAYYEN